MSRSDIHALPSLVIPPKLSIEDLPRAFSVIKALRCVDDRSDTRGILNVVLQLC